MDSLTRNAAKVNSACGCDDCTEDARLAALAARLGMAGPIVPADADPAVDPDTIAWGQVAPYHCPLPTEGPAEAEAEGPAERDDLWRLDTAPAWFLADAWGDDDLSPHEMALEVLGERAWDRAIREMEEDEADRQYDRLIDTLGGFPAGW